MTMICHPLRVASVLVAAISAAEPVAAQERPAQDRSLSIDGAAVAAPAARLDPLGVLRLSGAERAVRIEFPPLRWPAAGEHRPADTGAVRAIVWEERGVDHEADDARCTLEAFGPQRVAGVVELTLSGDGGASHRVEFDLPVSLGPLAPVVVEGARPVQPVAAPRDEPAAEDLVFCALGSGGTGLPGQHRVGAAVGRLAATGPLDFVLLLGGSFLPDGVESRTDPMWRSRFEDPYPIGELRFPFYSVLGDAEHRGKLEAYVQYGVFNTRWTQGHLTYSFEKESHGKRVGFFAAATPLLHLDIIRPDARHVRGMIHHALQVSKADWKIVFGYHPLRSYGEDFDAEIAARMKHVGVWLDEFDVDLYIAGGNRSLQLLGTSTGTAHVISGGAGGPELAASVAWGEDTEFAATGGGFAWFRFDGQTMEISFRDSDGAVLHTHRLRKDG